MAKNRITSTLTSVVSKLLYVTTMMMSLALLPSADGQQSAGGESAAAASAATAGGGRFLSPASSSGLTSSCERITIPMCMDTGYNGTRMPNYMGHTSQADAAIHVHEFLPLVQIGCSRHLKFFLCSLYAPMCADQVGLDVYGEGFVDVVVFVVVVVASWFPIEYAWFHMKQLEPHVPPFLPRN